jgi:hypothetical protein
VLEQAREQELVQAREQAQVPELELELELEQAPVQAREQVPELALELEQVREQEQVQAPGQELAQEWAAATTPPHGSSVTDPGRSTLRRTMRGTRRFRTTR